MSAPAAPAAHGSSPRAPRTRAPGRRAARLAALIAALGAQAAASAQDAGRGAHAGPALDAVLRAERAAPPDAVLAWGDGLHHIDVETGALTEWLGAGRLVRDVCWMPDPGHDTDTVFVLEGGKLARLQADTGRPVLAGAAGADAVRTAQVLRLGVHGTRLATIQLPEDSAVVDGPGAEGHAAGSGPQAGRPFLAEAEATTAWPGATEPGSDAVLGGLELLPPGVPLDALPDRFGSVPSAGWVFVELSPAQGLGPRLWNTEAEAPRPQPQPADEGWFVLGFAMAQTAPRAYALMAAPFSYTRLMACDLSGGLAQARWSPLDSKLSVADPQIMSLYLCTADGRVLLAGNGYRLDVLDGVQGGRRATLALQGVARDSDAVIDLCVLGVGHDEARHRGAPDARCGRDEAWVAGLVRAADAHGVPTGALKLAVWDLATGALMRLHDAPPGARQLTALPVDVTTGGPGTNDGSR